MLLKSSKTQLTPVTIFSVYCHLASASGALWQKLRDWGGASSLRPSGSLTQTQSHNHLQDCYWKTSILSSPVFLCTYPEQPDCTSLLFIFISLFIKSQYTVFCTSYCFLHILLFCTSYCFALFILHILLLFLFFYHIYALVLCYFYIILIFYYFALSTERTWFDYISLLVIPCIIYYVTNKETLNLEPLMQVIDLIVNY